MSLYLSIATGIDRAAAENASALPDAPRVEESRHPARWRLVGEGDALPDRLTPIYSTVSGIGQAKIRSAICGSPTTAPLHPAQSMRSPTRAGIG